MCVFGPTPLMAASDGWQIQHVPSELLIPPPETCSSSTQVVPTLSAAHSETKKPFWVLWHPLHFPPRPCPIIPRHLQILHLRYFSDPVFLSPLPQSSCFRTKSCLTRIIAIAVFCFCFLLFLWTAVLSITDIQRDWTCLMLALGSLHSYPRVPTRSPHCHQADLRASAS